MLNPQSLRHRYQAIAAEEPVRKFIEDAPEKAARDINDAWEAGQPIVPAGLASAGLNELSSRIASGYLSRRVGLVPRIFARRLKLMASPVGEKIHYAPIPETNLQLATLVSSKYCPIRDEQRQVRGSLSDWATGKKTSNAGNLCPVAIYHALQPMSSDGITCFYLQVERILLAHGAARGALHNGNLRLVRIDKLESIVGELRSRLTELHVTWSEPERFVDLLRVVYAEGKREECLLRAELLVAETKSLFHQRAQAQQHGDSAQIKSLDAAIGILYANLSEQVGLAATYGNLYCQCRDAGPQQQLEFKRTERADLFAALESDAAHHLPDAGARAAWVRGHPQITKLEKEIEALEKRAAS